MIGHPRPQERVEQPESMREPLSLLADGRVTRRAGSAVEKRFLENRLRVSAGFEHVDINDTSAYLFYGR